MDIIEFKEGMTKEQVEEVIGNFFNKKFYEIMDEEDDCEKAIVRVNDFIDNFVMSLTAQFGTDWGCMSNLPDIKDSINSAIRNCYITKAYVENNNISTMH